MRLLVRFLSLVLWLALAYPAMANGSQRQCSTDSDCRPGVCVSGVCKPVSERPCTIDWQCAGGTCVDGRCSPVKPLATACESNGDCLGGSCVAGTCSPQGFEGRGCTSDAQCPGGSCRDGKCSLLAPERPERAGPPAIWPVALLGVEPGRTPWKEVKQRLGVGATSMTPRDAVRVCFAVPSPAGFDEIWYSSDAMGGFGRMVTGAELRHVDGATICPLLPGSIPAVRFTNGLRLGSSLDEVLKALGPATESDGDTRVFRSVQGFKAAPDCEEAHLLEEWRVAFQRDAVRAISFSHDESC